MARYRVRKMPVTRKRRHAPPTTRPQPTRFLVLTGLAGAGKSQAIRALEDLGYFCIDNLPTTLIPRLAELTLAARRGIAKAAVVVDVRDRLFLSQFPKVFRTLRAQPPVASSADLSRSQRCRAGSPIQRDSTPSSAGR